MKVNKGVQLRLEVHNILYRIRKQNKTLRDESIKNVFNKYNDRDKSFINNVVLNSMRYYFHSKKIINLYVKKKQKINEEILLISSVAQIIFLNFKEYC